MPYNGLDVIFDTWSAATDIKTDVYALHIDSNPENSKAICMQGSINQETAEAYTQKITMFKTFVAKDFSLSGYQSKEYGVGDISLVKAVWDEYKNLIHGAQSIKGSGEKSITDKIELTITKVVLSSKKEYYFVATQEPSEKLYKKKKVYSVGDTLVSLKPNEFFTMCGDFDCIIDEEQKCFYSLKNTPVINRFKLREAIKNEVKSSESILDDWSFIDNVDGIKGCLEQQNVYEPLFKVFRDKQYTEELKAMTASDFKSRIIRVSKGKITDKDFKEDKLVITRSNRALFLDLLAKKMKYNIATDSVED